MLRDSDLTPHQLKLAHFEIEIPSDRVDEFREYAMGAQVCLTQTNRRAP